MPPAQRIMRNKDSLEVRRSRGEISCAECRRHKLKCDKAIPCSTCIRKGCSKLCPNGTLPPVQGVRSSASEVDTKRPSILEMTKRIRQLEDALQISHSAISKSPHPLLAADLLAHQSSSGPSTQAKQEGDSLDEQIVASIGMLDVSEKGVESYIGGVEEMWVKNIVSPEECVHPLVMQHRTMEEPISYLSHTFPFTPLYLPAHEIQAHIEEKLPSLERASALVEAYLENLSWFIRPIDREQIVEDLIPEVYRKRRIASSSNSASSTKDESPADPHLLALLFAVFSCGADGDLTLAPWNEEADLYYHLARAAVSLKPVLEGCSLHAVQAIALLAAHDLFSCRRNSLEGTWKMLSFSMSLAVSIGLHRDPSHFNLSPKMIQRRRLVFWELYSIDTGKSIGSGRPMMFSPSVVDCEFPEDKDATLSEDGRVIPSLWRSRYRFVKEVLVDVVSKLSSAQALKYSDIISLDKKIRDFGDQHLLQIASTAQPNMNNRPKFKNPFLLVLFKDTALLMLHRNFFARAMHENPTNPMKSHFAPSFLSTYHSAVAILKATREQLDSGAHFLMRLWPIWAHALCSGVIIGAIAACGSTSAYAPQAYAELNVAIDMFSIVQMHPLVKCGLPIMLKLRNKAYQALLKNGIKVSPPSSSYALPRPSEPNKGEEFNTVRGFGQVVRKGLSGEFTHTPKSLSELIEKMLPGKDLSTANATTKPTRLGCQNVNDTALPISAIPISAKYGSLKTGPNSKENGESNGFLQSGQRSNEDVMLSTFGTPPPGAPMELFPMFAQDRGFLANSRVPGSAESPRVEDNGHSPPPENPSMDIDGIPFLKDVATYHESAQEGTVNLALPTSQFAYSDHTSDPDSDNRTSYSGTDVNIGSADATMQPQMDIQSPFGYDNISSIMPTNSFDSDFNVSFDIGDESVLPLSPSDSDMQLWRTILQDSRFFGGNYGMFNEQSPL